MAGSLGSLVVSLGLNAAEFTTGLTKSEYEAKKFAQRLDRAITTGAKAAGAAILGMGAAAATAFAAISELASQAGNFKDLEEKTGANAEALASFAVAAGTAGVGIDTIAGAMNKLTKGLVTTEDETKDAGAALTALGIPLKEFKALDPAAQIETVAKALGGFKDGAAKSAVTMALFGKAGADLLPFLKELAAEGGRQVILTQQQIERADAFSDAQARTRTQVQLYVQALATEALPTITASILAAKNFAAAVLGIGTEARKLDANVIRQFAESAAKSLAFVVDSFDALIRIAQIAGTVVSTTAKQLAIPVGTGFLAEYNRLQDEASKKIDGIIARQTLRNALERQFAQDPNVKNGFHSSGIDFSTKKPLNFAGATGAGGGTAAKDRISDAQRYLDSLEKQIERTQELTATEQVRIDISKGIKRMTADMERQAFALAAQLDLAKSVKAATEAQKKIDEEAARIREQNSKALTAQTVEMQKEADALRAANDPLKEQLIFLQGGEDALRENAKAIIARTIATKEDTLASLQNTEGESARTDAIRGQIAALKDRIGLIDQVDIAAKMKIEVEKMQDLKNQFSDALVGPLVDFVNQTKSAKDAFRSFLNSIQQMLLQKAARGLADYIFGGKTESGFDFSTILKLLSGFAGGFGSSSGGVPGVGFSGGGFGEHFATGTAFAPGGRAWVGEQGPELVELPRGARVIPNSRARNMGGGAMIFNVNVMPGANTQSARQAGGLLRDVVVRSMKDR